MPPLRILIIGNGVAANAAAAVLSREGRGARVTLVSDEPHPLYSACALPYYLSGEVPRRRVFLKRKGDYRREGVRALLGLRARAIDLGRRRVEAEGSALAYDRLILATGSTPLIPPIPGVDLEGIYTFKTMADADRLAAHPGERAVVVGSGPIGVEAGVALRKKGWEVAIIELLGWVLPRIFDEPPAHRLAGALEENGISVLTGERVLRFLGDKKVEGLVTDKREMRCDLVVMAAGIRPEVSLAREAGIALGGLGGIATDGHLRTSAPDVLACGDCIENVERVSQRPYMCMLWHNAREQGEVAALSALGLPRAYPGSQNITVVNAFGTFAFSLGSNLADLAGEDGVDVVERATASAHHRLVLCRGVVRGAQAIGDTRFIGPLLAAIRRGEGLRPYLQGAGARHLLALNPWLCQAGWPFSS